jgi:ornithine carbamoyltransferase
MWQRFTERARRVVFFAQEEAARLGENYVGTEHLLLGLIRESDSVAARLLTQLGIALLQIRESIEKQVTQGHGNLGQDMQLTPRAKRVIDLAYEEARQLNNNYIGTEHLLLGLIREGDGLAARVLISLGANLERARTAVYGMQEEAPASDAVPDAETGPPAAEASPEDAARPEASQRFTQLARQAVDRAKEEARLLGEHYVGTEHLLLGLTHNMDNVACRILDRLGVPLSRIRADIERQVTRGPSVEGQPVQLTPRAKRAIGLAHDEARGLNNNFIGTEHLLLGLIREEDGLAARILIKLGADLERTRREVQAMQEGEHQPEATAHPPDAPGAVGHDPVLSMARLETLAQRTAWASLGTGGRRIAVGHAVSAARAVIAREGRLTDLVSCADLTPVQANAILTLAQALKASGDSERLAHRDILAGKTLAMVFEKPSLRTRVTFEVGMFQMGGHAISLQPAEIQLGQRETVADAARNLERWVNGIMARTFSHQHIVELAQRAGVPVINGLTDREHPCQALADFLTIRERKGRTQGLKLAYIGDGNNVCHSLLLLGAKLGTHIVVAHPKGYAPHDEIVRQAQEAATTTGAQIELTHDPQDAVRDADVIYTDVWASMGQEAEAQKRAKQFAAYQVNAELVSRAKWDTIVMHDLPAHRGQEITDDVMDGPQSAIFDQAENRLHAQKALLAVLL